MEKALVKTEIKEFPLYAKGKVRDIYDLKDKLLIIATDRISAFDVVLPNGIPGKGKVLNRMSLFWFELVKDIVENHIIVFEVEDYPRELHKYKDMLEGRSMLVKKAKRIDVECVVRGYISGSLWKEYKEKKDSAMSGNVELFGLNFPDNLKEADKLPFPIFTPATKAESGHDENISLEEMKKRFGASLSEYLKEKSLLIYQKCSDYAEKKGMIIADTKFEFGLLGEKIILIDEILSPDSSRFWSKMTYAPGKPQESFDKQFVRDYLERINWDKKPPAPELPEEIILKTKEKYEEALKRLIS
jgi:phosphoribosylaminoimidazole-succinocarboxamide synthase